MLFLIVLSSFWLELSGASKYNISYEILDSCKEYDATIGYNYRHFFKIKDFKNTQPGESEVLRLNVVILGSKDALILLSPKDDNDPNMAIYEIAIGAGGNTFNEIRRKRKMSPLKTKRMEILSPIDPVPFVIRLEKSGLIDVSVKADEMVPVISAQDPDPILNIGYISFSTWGSGVVRFFFDCPGDDGQQLEDSKSSAPQERLLNDLLHKTDSSVMPASADLVILENFVLRDLQFDEIRSMLTVRVSLDLVWNDTSLMWDPNEYSQIDKIRNPYRSNFWRPSLILLNSASEYFLDIHPDFVFTLSHDGAVRAESKDFSMKTFCGVANNSWPVAQTQCKIILTADGTSLMMDYRDELKVAITGKSKWVLERALEDEIVVAERVPFLVDLFETYDGSLMGVEYTLDIYHDQSELRMMYNMPILAAVAILLVSQLTCKPMRFVLVMLSVVITCFSLQALGGQKETIFATRLCFVLSFHLFVSWLTLVVSICLTWISQCSDDIPVPSWLLSCCSFRFMSGILASTGLFNTYGYLNERQYEWKDFEQVFNRIWIFVLVVYGAAVSLVL